MENSKIEWTDHTWNPWYGCQKVSPGCKNCYMYRDMQRTSLNPRQATRAKPATFCKPLAWKAPARVFTCSWSDFFIAEADPWRDDAWDIIRRTPWLTYQILTKRPENIPARLPGDWGEGYPNVWLGVSVENMEYHSRIWDLCQVPAAIRFISAEPLLGMIDLGMDAFLADSIGTPVLPLRKLSQLIHWVIAGGESGPAARPMHPQWLKFLRDQCREAKIPFFFKQWGEWLPGDQDGAGPAGEKTPRYQWDSSGFISHKVGKKNAGRRLDGQIHDAFPSPHNTQSPNNPGCP